MTMDQETGEILDVPPMPASQHAINAAIAKRQAERDEARGAGLKNIYTALIEAQKVIAPVMALDTDGHHTDKSGKKRKYTSYAGVIRAVREPLLDAGIIIRHRTERVFTLNEGGTSKSAWVTVITDLIHAESGEVISSELPMPIVRTDPQAVGIAIAYGKRYTLLSVLGLASGDPQEDDDAHSAMPRNLSEDDEDAEIIRDIEATETEAEANKLKSAYHKRINDLEQDAYARVKKAFQAHVKKLRDAPPKPKNAKKAEAA